MPLDEERVRPWLRLGRTVALFVVGIAGVIHETVVSHGERPTLLILFAAMIGLPFALKADEGSKAPAAPEKQPEKRDA